MATRARAINIALSTLSVVSGVGAAILIANHAPFSPLSTATSSPQAETAVLDTFVTRQIGRTDGMISVIAQLRDGSIQLSKDNRSELTAWNATIVHELPLVRSVALKMPRRNLTRLASATWVKHISLDSKVEKTDEFTTIASGATTAAAQYGVSGNGVTVAVVDSGIFPSDDLKDSALRSGGTFRIRATVDYVDDGNTSLKDENGHGTHVAGVIAGDGTASTGDPYYRTFKGIAPKANLVNVRVLDKYGRGDVSDVIAGLDWIIRNKAVYNIRVVNLSLGHEVGESFTTDPLCQAVEQVWRAGIVVVCAAGNEGRLNSTRSSSADNNGYGTNYGSIHSPGNSPYVITVGAARRNASNLLPYKSSMHSSDSVASYSSRGPSAGDLVLKPDLVAPGDRVISLQSSNGLLHDVVPGNQVRELFYMVNKNGASYSHDYYILSGTSIAAPVVAGAAALMIERDPTLTPDTIKARLMITSDKWTGPNGRTDPFTFGAGYVNVAAALRSTITTQGNALSPFIALDENGTLLVGQHASVWPDGTFWGTGITNLQDIWGTAVYRNTVVDNSRTMSGPVSSVQGDIVMWGGGSSRQQQAETIDAPTVNGDN